MSQQDNVCDSCGGGLIRRTEATSECYECAQKFYVDSDSGRPIRRIGIRPERTRQWIAPGRSVGMYLLDRKF